MLIELSEGVDKAAELAASLLPSSKNSLLLT